MQKLLFLVLSVVILVLALTVPAGNAGLPPQGWSLTVVVDPGHGGKDPGAQVAGVDEKDLNLAIALRLLSLADGHPRLRVILTRTSDRYVELVNRVRFAEKVGAVLYLSIHANACSDPAVCGVETYVDDSRPPEDPSWSLAWTVQAAVCAATGAADRGVRSQRLYLRHTDLPAALVEVGYLTCTAERRKLSSPGYQERIAQGIFQGILDFLGL
ncbi:MAG: N-acetylmuramoyl-L-alanine amidase [Acetothermia bacterium 64_32]|nr:MAG: N-acetylmuramoyl-L-alanine amidase [Acetothermia bacterium 64_32]HAF71310.1 hypothetical protein [Candidatus Acetothermia bacterium]